MKKGKYETVGKGTRRVITFGWRKRQNCLGTRLEITRTRTRGKWLVPKTLCLSTQEAYRLKVFLFEALGDKMRPSDFGQQEKAEKQADGSSE